MLASTRDVPNFIQSGIRLGYAEVYPRGAGKVIQEFFELIGPYDYNCALQRAQSDTVLRAMYDEVTARDEAKRDFLCADLV